MGGAAGHMKHPFDLPAVETGEDLVSFFETAAGWVLENTPALKIDGVNASFKLIDSEGTPSGKEFALDRGSAKPIDVEGITTARVGERWPEEHGMYSATKILLDIFNRALWHENGTYIKAELEQLGVWDDPTVIFNTEFVLKNLNVKEYKTNFIALHGINKFSWATKRRRASKEIAYSRDALEILRDKVAPFAKTAKNLQGENLDMEVYTSVPVEPLQTEAAGIERTDFSNTLNSAFPIHHEYGQPPIEKSLGEWLSDAVNPRGTKIPLVTGRKVGALSKEIYKVVLNTTEPLADLLGEDEESIKLARDGAIFYHATRLLGNDVLATLTAGEDFGPVNEEEGIVLRDRIAFGTDDPVKITGNFILGGEAGKLAQKARAPAKETEKAGNIIALFPGGFKPPHAGHFELAKRYAEDPQVSKVLMLLGPAIRTSKDGSIKITKESSIHVISEFYKQYLGDKVTIVDSPAGEENPMRAAFKWIEEKAQPGETYTLAASNKDPKRAIMFAEGHKCPDGKYCKDGVQVVLHTVDTQALVYSGRTDGLNGKPISASVMREDLANGDKQNFATNLPAAVADYIDEIFDFLGGVKKIEELPPKLKERRIELFNYLVGEAEKETQGENIKMDSNWIKKMVMEAFKASQNPTELEEADIEEDKVFKRSQGQKQTVPHSEDEPIEKKKKKKKVVRSKKKKSKKQRLETSSVGGGGFAFGASKKDEPYNEGKNNAMNKEEQILREHIRNMIQKKFQNLKEEEGVLRKYIRTVLAEAKETAYTNSTGVNSAAPILDTVVPTINGIYSSLRTTPEQRASFKRHFTRGLETFFNLLEMSVFGPAGSPGADELPSPAVTEPTAEPGLELDIEEPEPAPMQEQVATTPMPDAAGATPGPDSRPDEEKEFSAEVEAAEKAEAAAEEQKARDEMMKTQAGEELGPFPTLADEDLTGRGRAMDALKGTKTLLEKGYVNLHNRNDRLDFKNWTIVNVARHLDLIEKSFPGGGLPFEDETQKKYETALGIPAPNEQAAPEVATTMAGPSPSPEPALQEDINNIINSAIKKVINI